MLCQTMKCRSVLGFMGLGPLSFLGSPFLSLASLFASVAMEHLPAAGREGVGGLVESHHELASKALNG